MLLFFNLKEGDGGGNRKKKTAFIYYVDFLNISTDKIQPALILIIKKREIFCTKIKI